MAVVKNNFVVIILSIFCFSMLIFIASSYINAQPDSRAESTTKIKIPPPIDVVLLPDVREPQELNKVPIAILTSSGDMYKYIVEIANTPEQRRIGMMFRNYIDENTGMLFAFKNEAERSFWMKNVSIPLDMLFIRTDGVITHIHHMAEEGSLKPISSNGKVIAVLEIAGGEAEILDIKVGDRILYKDF